MDASESIQSIKPDCVGLPIDVRVIRKWGDAIQVTVDKDDRDYVESRLSLSGCYGISNYIAHSAGSYMKVVKHNALLRIGQASTIIPITGTKVTTFSDCLQLQSTAASSCVYLNPSINMTNTLLERIPIQTPLPRLTILTQRQTQETPITLAALELKQRQQILHHSSTSKRVLFNPPDERLHDIECQLMTMNISPKKLLIIRFLINPVSVKTLNSNPLISSVASLLSAPATPSMNTSIYNSNYACSSYRCFSVVSDDNSLISNQNVESVNTRAPVTRRRITDTRNPLYVSPKLVSQITDIVRSSKGECRSKLDLIDTRLSKVPICEIIKVLSFEKVPAMQFFEWVRDNHPDLYCNGDICSLMVDNCGWLNDFDTMRALLKQFKQERICLDDKAFGFLPVLDSSKANAMESITLVIQVLDEIGGSVRGSGVYALIHMLCVADCFDLSILLARLHQEKGNIDAAGRILNEMMEKGLKPDFLYYAKTIKILRLVGGKDLALDLKNKFAKFRVE
ncbi:hypothetical protein E3N88_44696 [Mikania micrantha]|uniref:Pentatricopeptide repeat-containing protein n=1 Tax=Mikania micrantha TaxID=192012 RepID=A0A5N6LBA3_9ASTR|nr:hypothetical protein E3N88_44696 [Mikania micrantha]